MIGMFASRAVRKLSIVVDELGLEVRKLIKRVESLEEKMKEMVKK